MFGIAERRLLDSRDSSFFLRYAKNYTSQGGEDGILEEIFRMVGTSAQPYCVEIGAWDGKHLSNSYRLVYEQKWSGLLVEANPERCHALSSLYVERPDVTCLECLVNIDGDQSLMTVLKQHSVAEDFDFISIDVDGADYHLWSSIGAQFRARVVCIEFNPTIPNHVHYVQARDITVQEGSSLLALVELGRSLGYHVVATTTFNAIFVRDDLLPLLPEGVFSYLPLPGSQSATWAPPTPVRQATLNRVVDLNSLHNCAMATDLFQTYSGEIKLCGPKKLLWHRVPMNVQQMQAIKPKKERVFPFKPPYQQALSSLERYLRGVSLALALVVQQGSSAVEPTLLTKLTMCTTDMSALLQECAGIFGVDSDDSNAQRSQQPGAQCSGGPLRGIAEEALLNALLMCMVAHRHVVATSPCEDSCSSKSGDIEGLLRRWIEQAADLCLRIGDALWSQYASPGPRAASKETKEVLLETAQRWWERAVYSLTQCRDCRSEAATATVDGKGTYPAVQRKLRQLSSKLSSCFLAQTSCVLPWEPILQKASSIGTSAAVDGKQVECALPAVCCATEEADALLRGLFWKKGAIPRGLGDGRQCMNEEENMLYEKLGKRWFGKLRWAVGRTGEGHSVESKMNQEYATVTTDRGIEKTISSTVNFTDYSWMILSFIGGGIVGSFIVGRIGLIYKQ